MSRDQKRGVSAVCCTVLMSNPLDFWSGLGVGPGAAALVVRPNHAKKQFLVAASQVPTVALFEHFYFCLLVYSFFVCACTDQKLMTAAIGGVRSTVVAAAIERGERYFMSNCTGLQCPACWLLSKGRRRVWIEVARYNSLARFFTIAGGKFHAYN